MDKKEYIKKWRIENRERLTEYKRQWAEKKRIENWINNIQNCATCDGNFKPVSWENKTCPACQEKQKEKVQNELLEKRERLNNLAHAIVTGKIRARRRLI
jgi:hypothetical protein